MGRSPLIMFLGDDVELKPGAIETVVRRLDDVSIGVVGAKLMFPKNSLHPNRPAGKVQHVGLTLNVRGEITHPLIGWNPDHPKTSISRDVWAVTGACFTIRRSLFNRFGGFDPVFGLGTCEDVDLCMKVRQAGFRVFLDAEAQGYHYVGASAEKLQVAFPVQQNQQIFMNRWARSGLVYWTEYEYF
jgi:GT2 family glycosyltransferase